MHVVFQLNNEQVARARQAINHAKPEPDCLKEFYYYSGNILGYLEIEVIGIGQFKLHLKNDLLRYEGAHWETFQQVDALNVIHRILGAEWQTTPTALVSTKWPNCHWYERVCDYIESRGTLAEWIQFQKDTRSYPPIPRRFTTAVEVWRALENGNSLKRLTVSQDEINLVMQYWNDHIKYWSENTLF